MFEKYEKMNSLNLFDFHTLAAILWIMHSVNVEIYLLFIKNFNIIYVVDIQYIFYQCEKFN